MAKALDLDRESPRLRERYGRGTERYQGDAAPRLNGEDMWHEALIMLIHDRGNWWRRSADIVGKGRQHRADHCSPIRLP